MSFPLISRQSLSPTIIFPTPDQEDLFIPFLNRLYEDISSVVNSKDYNFFPIPITNTATNIPNLPNYGSFIVAISGVDAGLPTLIAALTKADANQAGTIASLGAQAGNLGTWVGATLTITSTATNFQIHHSVAGTTGNFNIRIMGTQFGG